MANAKQRVGHWVGCCVPTINFRWELFRSHKMVYHQEHLEKARETFPFIPEWTVLVAVREPWAKVTEILEKLELL